MTNKAIARQLKLTADLIELTGGNPFRARAYASASRVVDRMDESAQALAASGDLVGVKGIGKGLAAEIGEFVETGAMSVTESMLQALPPGLPEVLRVKGLGVKKVRALWQEAGVTSLEDLEAAAAAGRLAELPGFGAKTVENILGAVEQLKAYRGKAHFRDAALAAIALRDTLRGTGIRCDLAGAVRRQCNEIDRLDLVAAAEAEAVVTAPDLDLVASGERLDGTLASGMPVTVWLTSDAAYGRVLFERTGPDEHVDAVAERAPLADAADEDEIYDAAGVAPLAPPLRDDPYWLESGARPTLVRTADQQGTIHNHTTASDGAYTLREMCDAARQRGLHYFGVCDHSRSLQIAHGLSIDALRQQITDVRQLTETYRDEGVNFRVFAGSEVDILSDGSMDYPDEVLAQLDLVVASVHTGFRMSEDEATARVVAAVSNPYVDVLGHPTGRLLLRREGYPLDHEAVLDACAAHGVAVELNASPWRLDIDWRFLRAATGRGVQVSINPDAHSVDGLDDVRWGVASAQKGGLTAAHSLTAKSADDLADWLAARRPVT
ncbi:MAG: helix-hairpin-helix domain-containing protein [Bacteroidota bacterium]